MVSFSGKASAPVQRSGVPVIGGRFKLMKPLGEGAFAMVHQAIDQTDGNTVAVKITNSRFSCDEVAKAFFQAEQAALSRIRSPGVPAYITHAEHDARPYLVMEEAPGLQLRKTEQSFYRPCRNLLSLLSRICSALSDVHALGIVHRDLVPDNIIVSGTPEDPLVKLVDFGICKLPDLDPVFSSDYSLAYPPGSPHYMSPEQILQTRENRTLDQRSDLYSVGVLAYALATKFHYPFTHDKYKKMMGMHLNNDPIPLNKRNPSVPGQLCRIVDQLLHNDPDQRFQTAAELKAALDACAV